MHLKLVGVGFQSDFTATVEFFDSGAFNFNEFMEIIYGLNNFNFIETKQVQNIIVIFSIKFISTVFDNKRKL